MFAMIFRQAYFFFHFELSYIMSSLLNSPNIKLMCKLYDHKMLYQKIEIYQ